MGMEEEYLLAMEKSVDSERCGDKNFLEVPKKQNSSESQCCGMWHLLAFILFALSIISGAFQFCGPMHERRSIHVIQITRLDPINTETPRDLENFLQPETPLEAPSDPDYSKSMSIVLNRFRDHSKRNSSLPSKMFKPSGEALVRNGRAYLTSQIASDDNGVIPKANSVGRLMHPRPLCMKHRGEHPGDEKVVSFHTTFVFSIENSLGDREATGDGFTFLIVPQNNAVRGAGGHLGVIDGDDASHYLAVEFDIWKNPALHDINNNHVGINVNSMVSGVASEAGYWSRDGTVGEQFRKLDLTSGKIQAWIDYEGPSQQLTVSVSPNLGSKPVKPLLSKRLDLTKVFEKYMYVGFSAATGEFSAKHIIHSWRFEKHVNIHTSQEGFTSPRLRNPHTDREDRREVHLVALPSKFQTCKDRIHSASMALYSNVKDFFQRWQWTLIGFALGLVATHIAFFLYQACLGCSVGVVDCYESSRELQHLAEVDNQGRFVLVLSEPEHPRDPRNLV